MLEFLKDHPFAVKAHFDFSLVVTFAVPLAELQSRLPECLEADGFQDQWGFVTVAMVQTKALRPKGFPPVLGNDFFLTGYRFFVRYRNARGKSLRGLYILRSETDKRKMKVLGNTFTHYNYQYVDMKKVISENDWKLSAPDSGFYFHAATGEEIALPEGSPFADWKEARRFAGPLPFTFTWTEEKKKVLIIEGVRENWTPAPLEVKEYVFPFINSLGFSRTVLANAFIVKNIPYEWKKGKMELWPH